MAGGPEAPAAPPGRPARARRRGAALERAILRALLAGARDDPRLLAQIQESAADPGSAAWLTLLARAVARGEAAPETLHPRVATVAVVLLRNEFIVRGYPVAPDSVLVEIVDEVYLPLIRGRGGREAGVPGERTRDPRDDRAGR